MGVVVRKKTTAVAVMVIVGAELVVACYPRMFSFGDSLADTGNNSSEPTLL